MAKASTSSFIREPRVALVLIAGALTIIFLVAIVRELLQGHQVRNQVNGLRYGVVAEQQRQQDLQNLLTYLQSPTFQERQARLELGLKKSGERVLVVPPNQNTNADQNSGGADAEVGATAPVTSSNTNPSRWLQYFFHR